MFRLSLIVAAAVFAAGSGQAASVFSTEDPTWEQSIDGGMDALLEGGTLRLDGECLVVEREDQRVVIVWTASEAHMVVDADGVLLDVVVDGRSQRPFDQVRLGGGYVDPAMWPVEIHDLPPSCADGPVFVAW
jgi:hypothetical protein